ncbi:DsbA family protein [Candidatus Nitrospira allomarina]|jgi:protein-disulfide isomerase|uniref:Thioredoxin domain-containing protein n=1 Tax=Candidatus Nitrospira allomarina TaxID=3020900 RepID=A0AA96GAW2_9BACT|nr:thioredoxin domain-containing protein [Candidatus Nitrospira allomarina]WNM58659.1 thioredoxin domain-containing protein [Candidatus Nitrospira allomarina]
MPKQLNISTTYFMWRIGGGLLGSILLLPFLLFAQEPPIPSSVETTDVFILRQLIEVQNELRDVRKELAEVRKSVSELQGSSNLPLAAAPRPSAVGNVELNSDDPTLGSQKAKVAIVEFTDYQCPYCAKYHSDTFENLKKEYIDTGKVQYVLRDFPLDFHAYAIGAAIAANCAGEQDAYWQMNHQLFSNQSELGDGLYQKLARSLGLNMDLFESCVNSPEQIQEVDADVVYGQEIGVNGTPTFFIGRVENGQLTDAKEVSGTQPLSAFSRIIEPLLVSDGNVSE